MKPNYAISAFGNIFSPQVRSISNLHLLANELDLNSIANLFSLAFELYC